jgi:hypothetical protein
MLRPMLVRNDARKIECTRTLKIRGCRGLR